jgi:hypothetical protein
LHIALYIFLLYSIGGLIVPAASIYSSAKSRE